MRLHRAKAGFVSGRALFGDIADAIDGWVNDKTDARDRARLAKIQDRLKAVERLEALFLKAWQEHPAVDRKSVRADLMTLGEDFTLNFGEPDRQQKMNAFLWGSARRKDTLTRTVARDYLAIHEDVHWMLQITPKLSSGPMRSSVEELIFGIIGKVRTAAPGLPVPPPFDRRWTWRPRA
ncbi:MAG: hypothetical protein ACMVY4_17525 [Minwuia sp.]|uniref:hypothetical protein n=1 Tax=Minwuia sp. TaxID=2493630 RepID=UPI003A8AC190